MQNERDRDEPKSWFRFFGTGRQMNSLVLDSELLQISPISFYGIFTCTIGLNLSGLANLASGATHPLRVDSSQPLKGRKKFRCGKKAQNRKWFLHFSFRSTSMEITGSAPLQGRRCGEAA